MPQNPNQVYSSLNPSNVPAASKVDAVGSLRTVSSPGLSTLNMTAATLVKSGAGRVGTINVVVGGSAAGAVHDCATTGAASAANKIAVLPQTNPSTIPLNFPVTLGLVVVPGTGQTITACYE